MTFSILLRKSSAPSAEISVAYTWASGSLFRKGNGNASRAGADISDLEASSGKPRIATGSNFANCEAIERDLDEMLGLRARNEDIGRDLKFQSPEFLFAGEMLRRLTAGTAANQFRKLISGFVGQNLFGMGVDPGAIATGCMQEEEVLQRE